MPRWPRPYDNAHGFITGDTSRFSDFVAALRRGAVYLTRVTGIVISKQGLTEAGSINDAVRGPIGVGPYLGTWPKVTVPTKDYIGYRGILPLNVQPRYKKKLPFQLGTGE